MQHEIGRTRTIYVRADTGIDLLSGRSKECVRAARLLYGGILDRIEAADYDVFSKRARVSHVRKVAAASRAVDWLAPFRRRSALGPA